MASARYCILENTANDLAECVNKLIDEHFKAGNLSGLSQSEKEGAARIYRLVDEYKRIYEELVNNSK